MLTYADVCWVLQQVSDTNSARLDHFRMLRRDLDAAMTCFISAKKEERERANQAKAHAAALTAAQQVLKALLRLYQDSGKALVRLYQDSVKAVVRLYVSPS